MIDEKLTTPIYQQIANELEDMILRGELEEEAQAPSMNQLADYYKINPATARKGLEILANENILYKKKGIGMFVTNGATKQIMRIRKKAFFDEFITKLMDEAYKLGLSKEEIIEMIDENDRKGQR